MSETPEDFPAPDPNELLLDPAVDGDDVELDAMTAWEDENTKWQDEVEGEVPA